MWGGFRDSKPDLIAEGLYLGNATHGSSRSTLQKLGISNIVNVTPYLSRTLGPEFQVLHIDIHDHPNVEISTHFDTAFEFIDKALADPSKRVLVHCEMGMSRSSTIVIMYLMRAFDLTLREALIMTRLRRSIVNPNNGFMRQLAELELKLKGTNSVDVSLFRDAFGSGAMFVDIPPEWKQRGVPPPPCHPKRAQAAADPAEQPSQAEMGTNDAAMAASSTDIQDLV